MAPQSHGVGPHGESQINNGWRALLLAAFAMDESDESGLASVLRGQHAAREGTPIPASLPGFERLRAAGYLWLEDFDGASVDELVSNVPRLSSAEAFAALSALGFVHVQHRPRTSRR